MLVTALVSLALAAGAPPVVVGIAVLTVLAPPVGSAAGVGILTLRWRRRAKRRPGAIDEAAFCASVAAELRAGASLRKAVATVAADESSVHTAAAARSALVGAPAAEVASRLERALPVYGRRAGLAFALAADTGAGAAAVFDRLAAGAARDEDLRRERRTLTAQARLSAAVVGAAPVAVLVLLAAAGRIEPPGRAGTLETFIVAIGVALVAIGLAVVWLLVRGEDP